MPKRAAVTKTRKDLTSEWHLRQLPNRVKEHTLSSSNKLTQAVVDANGQMNLKTKAHVSLAQTDAKIMDLGLPLVRTTPDNMK